MATNPKSKKTIWIGTALLACIVLTWWFWPDQDEAGKQRYKTERVDRGDIRQLITANGTVNPVVLVNVGTQVSGTIKQLHVDFNQTVKPGQILAELDPALFQAAVKQSEANLANAEAALKLAQAKHLRSRDLLAKNFISQTAMDEAAQALSAAQAQVRLARAQVERDQTNLRYAVIRSPIAGVVVARNVDVGQTVAASFQTPTLFQIAQDLGNMQIDTSVAEADVGLIHVGQAVLFSVDAFPEKTFEGKVKQIRLNPTIQQNVVTYNVVVGVDNREGRLLPGMTAHVRIVVAERTGVLRVPNAALRFKPEANAEAEISSDLRNKPLDKKQVYRLEQENKLTPISIMPGITDGSYTEVLDGKLQTGDMLVTTDTQQRKEKASRSFRLRIF